MRTLKPLRVIGVSAPAEASPPTAPLFLTPVQAGWPSPADDYIDARINLHELLVTNPPATFFLRAAGDSMIECGIRDGDLLVVDRSRDVAPNRVVIAAVDGELLVKRLKRAGGKTWLAPANPEYPDIDITDREYVYIWGVVTYVIHRLL